MKSKRLAGGVGLALTLLATTVVALGVLVLLTWRPWADGADARATSSGILPVCTFLLGQVVSFAIAALTRDGELQTRQFELDAADRSRREERAWEAEQQLLAEKRADAEAQRAEVWRPYDDVVLAVTGLVFQRPFAQESLARFHASLLRLDERVSPSQADIVGVIESCHRALDGVIGSLKTTHPHQHDADLRNEAVRLANAITTYRYNERVRVGEGETPQG